MKTRKLLPIFSILFLIIILGVSCEKDRIDPIDPPVVTKPQVELNVPEEVIPYGAECTIDWWTDATYCSLNKETVPSTGNKTIKLLKDSLFTFIAVNNNTVMNKVEKTIRVGDWTTSLFGFLTYNEPWMLKSLRYRQNGEIVWESALNKEQITNKFYFYPDETSAIIRSDGVTIGNGPWTLSKDGTILTMGGNYLIISLTKDQLIISIETNFYGKPATFEQEYYRILN